MVSDRSNGIYRSVLAALVGLILVSAASPVQKEVDGKKDATQEQIANTVQGVALAINDSNKPDQATQPCQKGKDNRHSDLCAQWKAADAAKQSADSADKSVTISWIGLALGGVTMIAAIAAAIFAERAAFHTKRSSELYRKRESGFIVPTITFTQNFADIQFKNIGPTQIQILAADCWVYADNAPGIVPFIMSGGFISGRMLNSGDIYHFGGPRPMPNGSQNVEIVGAMIYETVFDQVQVGRLHWKYDRIANKFEVLFNGDFSEWEKRARQIMQPKKRWYQK